MNGVEECKKLFFKVLILRINWKRMDKVNMERKRIRIGIEEGKIKNIGIIIKFEKGFEVRLK